MCFRYFFEFTKWHFNPPPLFKKNATTPRKTHLHPSSPDFPSILKNQRHIFGRPNGTPGFAIVDMCSDLKQPRINVCMAWFVFALTPNKDLFFEFLWWVEITQHKTRGWFVFNSNFNFRPCGLDHWPFFVKQTAQTKSRGFCTILVMFLMVHLGTIKDIRICSISSFVGIFPYVPGKKTTNTPFLMSFVSFRSTWCQKMNLPKKKNIWFPTTLAVHKRKWLITHH